MSDKRILLTGVNGQVGFELARSLQGLGTVVALDRAGLDLSSPDKIREVVRSVSPSLIVNPAAYTAVDKAETERDAAHAINATAPGILAEEAKRGGIPLIHYSTDYVYAGDKNGIYTEADPTDPQNVYGASKLAGEEAIRASGCAHVIFRTSWVYGVQGGNFVKTMLRLAADRPALKVVGDQWGAPTSARTIADITAHIVAQAASPQLSGGTSDKGLVWWEAKSGVYHLVAGGETNWAEYAKTIFALKGLGCEVTAIPASEYPVPAKRPSNSRLSTEKLQQTFGIQPPQWEVALRHCLESI
ncbi:dTDP-4-dehydrorhamnose reductase [Robbsia sp. KACC 23696]|uniref:dTDP-4-dehydrorhamnose reductase n=1 Tax=Robbsia sp. KACC 23696 TaxID=3149231 RepID=UPI00325AA351